MSTDAHHRPIYHRTRPIMATFPRNETDPYETDAQTRIVSHLFQRVIQSSNQRTNWLITLEIKEPIHSRRGSKPAFLMKTSLLVHLSKKLPNTQTKYPRRTRPKKCLISVQRSFFRWMGADTTLFHRAITVLQYSIQSEHSPHYLSNRSVARSRYIQSPSDEGFGSNSRIQIKPVHPNICIAGRVEYFERIQERMVFWVMGT